jgi:hypothetical protein
MAIGAFSYLQRPSQDVANETRLDARYVGNLDVGRSSIGIRSALVKGDTEDNFRFRLLEEANLSLSAAVLQPAPPGSDTKQDPAPEGTVRIQLLGVGGRILADSDPRTGAAYTAYQKLSSEKNIKLSRGDYTVRITRGPKGNSQTDYTYLMSLRSGRQAVDPGSPDTSNRYFETIERPAPLVAASTASADPVSGMFSGLVNILA